MSNNVHNVAEQLFLVITLSRGITKVIIVIARLIKSHKLKKTEKKSHHDRAVVSCIPLSKGGEFL